MRKIVVIFLVLFSTNTAFCQIENPVSWQFSSKKINATTYQLFFTANIKSGWHIYSQSTPNGGPVATSFNYNKNPLVTIEGVIKETGKLEKHFEKLFGVAVKQYSGKVTFLQIVKLKGAVKTSLGGTIKFMTCNDSKCLPPQTISFNMPLN